MHATALKSKNQKCLKTWFFVFSLSFAGFSPKRPRFTVRTLISCFYTLVFKTECLTRSQSETTTTSGKKVETGLGFCDLARIRRRCAGFCSSCCFNQVLRDNFSGSCVFVLALSRGAFFCLFVFSFFAVLFLCPQSVFVM